MFAAGCVVLALAQCAAAQQVPVFPGSETVVTAGRVPQRLSDALRNVTVITAADIEQSGQLTLAQVLQQFGGLEMVSNGGQGNAASVFIRGANAAHTLVLVDGIRLQSATLGTTAFENIPLAQIERIEIVPGPVSSLYGSDAIGGVIQIFTKSRRSTPAVDVTASLGSYATRALKAAASSTFGATDLTLSAGFFATDSFSATKPTVSFNRFNPDDDGYRNSNFSAKVAHRFSPGNEAGASVFYSDGEAHFDSGPTTDNLTDQKLTVYSVHSQNQVSAAWQSLVRIGASRDDSASLGGATVSTFKTDQTQATWQNTFTLAQGLSLVAGAEYLKQEVDTTTAYVVTERTIKSVFAGLNGDYGNHGVQASARRDDNSQFGAPTTGSIAYGYRITPGMRLRAAYGTAFHAPSFNDLYFPGFGNPDVKPERSRNREIGFDYESAGQRFVATYFDNRVSDLIVFVFDPVTSTSRPENVSKARIRGTELSYGARVLETQVRAKLTLQDPEAEPTGFQLQRRAKRHGSLMASRAFGAWTLGAEMVASGQRFDSSNESPASRMPGYALFNLTLARSITPEWSVDVRWNNVADKEYELIPGFNTPGSNVLVSLRWTPSR
jgi:vitamin B12 transporter